MADLREQILARLAVIVASLSGLESSGRNLDSTSDYRTPAAVLFDGDEEAYENLSAVGTRPNVVTLLPIIQLSLGDVPESVGTAANEWRLKVLKAVLGDATIATLCAGIRSGGARYVAMQSSLAPGRETFVTLTFHFAVAFPFQPADF